MSKSLAFLELTRAVSDHDKHQMDQVIFEEDPISIPNPYGETFRNLLSFAERSVDLGDVVEIRGYPEKTRRGRLSFHAQFIRTITKSLARKEHRESLQDQGPLADSAASQLPLCKFALRKMKCPRDECPLRHDPTESELARMERLRLAKEAVLAKEHDEHDPFEDKNSKKLRASIFSKWLVGTFGTERLNTGSGVLDVAGGLGRLSYSLQIDHGVKTTLVEPRSIKKLSKSHAKFYKENNVEPFVHIQDFFTEEMWTGADCPRAVLECSIVVGLHPDQATETIVDYALSHNKPFAVVPCCVFANLWPDRRVGDRPVVTYFDFIDYLQQKDSRIKIDYLNMSGRNKVIFFDPNST